MTKVFPKGFEYYPDFISEDEEENLLHEIKKLDWQAVKMYGVTAKRKVVHFGLDYAYNSRQVQRTEPPPIFLKKIIKESAQKMEVTSEDIDEILITKYPAGSQIGWHKDAIVFGNKIFGISLATSCIMKLRKKHNDKYKIYTIELAPRSAYLLSDDARYFCQHCIAPVKKVRYSITLRSLEKKLKK